MQNTTINRGDAPKQTIYFLGRSLGKDDDEKENLSFSSSFDNATTETGKGLETATLVINPSLCELRTRRIFLQPCGVKSGWRWRMEIPPRSVLVAKRHQGQKARRSWQRS